MTPLILPAIAATILVTLGYAMVCAASPFGDCRRCGGLGFALRNDRHGIPKRGKTCRRCKGVGKRIRLGRHAYNLAYRTWRSGTR
ncbi:hypothetical protein Kpho02_07440 [Kitasatospora phosalacinea]|uniref:Uncharacterized protein n=1 Tax=Kitasatospora phosalacinea TaxID=2065 RepID=A0A9W6Q1T6_9ACTN|nr:hypothetical protein [Kitasatospora phosalacinea]GLW68445.1 hypothetical protein Kpho02_07440 [Kitasatospora phosalacinea]